MFSQKGILVCGIAAILRATSYLYSGSDGAVRFFECLL